MAMLKNKHLTFSLILVCLAVVSPMAKAQRLPGGLVNIVTINGLVSCTLNATLNGTAAPHFPNATVQLQCGPLNAVVATTTTNRNGIFTFFPTQIPVSPATLISDCRIFVATPLARCNATLPSVNLTSPLNVVGSLVTGLINFFLITPTRLVAIFTNI